MIEGNWFKCEVDQIKHSLCSWENDVVGMVEEKHGKKKILVSFECETLKAEKAAEDHIRQFMPKLAGLEAVGMQYAIFVFFVNI